MEPDPQAFESWLIASACARQVISRIRKRFPKIDGDLVILAASILSIAFCVAVDLRVLSAWGIHAYPWADYLATGISIALGAGLLNDFAKAKKDPTEEPAP